MVSVSIDKDEKLGYETSAGLRKVWDFSLATVLNNLPSALRGAIRKTHKSAEEIIDHATTHKALEILYNDGYPERAGNWLQRFFHLVWFSTANSRAVRNRLRLVKREITGKLMSLAKEKGEIRMLSIASGSARAVIESMEAAREKLAGKSVIAVFLDKNPAALEYSKALAARAALPFELHWVNDSAGNYLRSGRAGEKYDIVEMVGLMDYFDDDRAEATFAQINDRLHPGGMLVTANICDNYERRFVTKVVGWDMIYRTADDLAKLVMQAGFKHNAVRAMYEPFKIHAVVVAEKS